MLIDNPVMVTGADGGIGRAMILAFAKNKASVIACSRKLADDFNSYCRGIEKDHGVRIHNVIFDITEHHLVKQKIIAVSKEIGCPSVLINNAGIFHEALIHMTSLDMVKRIFEINVNAVFYITQLVTKLMMRNKIKGSIINISSVSAHDGVEGQSAYGASKAAVESLSKSIARELGRFGIRINCIAPGIVITPMAELMSAEILSIYERNSYLKKLATSEDIANTAIFLASELSSHITGQVIRVDGGQN